MVTENLRADNTNYLNLKPTNNYNCLIISSDEPTAARECVALACQDWSLKGFVPSTQAMLQIFLTLIILASVKCNVDRKDSVVDRTSRLLQDSPGILTFQIFVLAKIPTKFELKFSVHLSVPRTLSISDFSNNDSTNAFELKRKFTTYETLNLIIIEDNTSTLPTWWLSHQSRDHSYFILYASNSHFNVFQIQQVFQLKFRIKMQIFESGLHFSSVCFYCDGGHAQEHMIATAENLHDIFQDYTRDLNGTILRVTSSKGNYRSMNYKELANGTVAFAGGYSHEIFFCLKRKFNFNFHFFMSKGFGLKLPNGTFTGVIGNLAAGRADYAMETGFNFQRFAVVEYMPPAVFESLTFLTKIPAEETKFFLVFEPFTVESWAAVMFTGVVIALSYAGLISLSQLLDSNHELEFWKNFQGGIGFYVRPFLDQGIASHAWDNFRKLRLVGIAWLLTVIILGTGYRAKLTTLMAYPLLEVLPNDFNELAASKYIIYLHDIGGVPQAIFQSNPTLRAVLARMRKEKSLLKCIGATVNERAACVTLGDNGIFEGVKNFSNVGGKLMVHKAPTNLYPFLPGAPVLRKGQVFGTNFAGVIRRIFDMGIVYKFQADEAAYEAKNGKTWARARVQVDPWRKPEPEGPQPIKMEEIKAVLILCAGFKTLAAIAFVTELVIMLYKKRSELHRLSTDEPQNGSTWETLKQRGYILTTSATTTEIKPKDHIRCRMRVIIKRVLRVA